MMMDPYSAAPIMNLKSNQPYSSHQTPDPGF